MLRLLLACAAGAGGFPSPYTTIEAQPPAVFDDSDTYKGAGIPALMDGVYYRVWSVIDSHGGANGDIWWSKSTDDLATWETPAVLVTHASTKHLAEAAVLATSTGRLVVAYNDKFDADLYSTRIKVIYSDDGGATWSSPYSVPYGDTLTGEQAGSGLIELANGDILLVAYGDTGVDANWISGHYRSTDGGATFPTWTLISTLHNPAEPQIVRMPDGTLAAFMRSVVDAKMYRSAGDATGTTWAVSTDCGPLNGKPAVAEVFAGHWVWVGRSDEGPDFHRRWATSTDGGVTWTTPAELDVGETRRGEDANLLSVTDGRVLCFDAYEDAADQTTVYLRWFVGA